MAASGSWRPARRRSARRCCAPSVALFASTVSRQGSVDPGAVLRRRLTAIDCSRSPRQEARAFASGRRHYSAPAGVRRHRDQRPRQRRKRPEARSCGTARSISTTAASLDRRSPPSPADTCAFSSRRPPPLRWLPAPPVAVRPSAPVLHRADTAGFRSGFSRQIDRPVSASGSPVVFRSVNLVHLLRRSRSRLRTSRSGGRRRQRWFGVGATTLAVFRIEALLRTSAQPAEPGASTSSGLRQLTGRARPAVPAHPHLCCPAGAQLLTPKPARRPPPRRAARRPVHTAGSAPRSHPTTSRQAWWTWAIP